jgi:hypothetical protein
MMSFRIVCVCLVTSTCWLLTADAMADGTEKQVLKSGWNLIGIPVAPVNPQIKSVFKGPIENKWLLSVWTCDNSNGWSKAEFRDQRDAQGPPNDWVNAKVDRIPPIGGGIKELIRIEAGRGYWVQISSEAPGDGVLLEYETQVTRTDGAVKYFQGWNLVSFDAETKQQYLRPRAKTLLQKSQPQPPQSVPRSSITSIFGLADGQNVHPTRILEYDARRPKLVETQLAAALENDDGDSERGQWLRRGAGYWCYFSQDCVLKQAMVTILEGDDDLDPKRPLPFPGPEDFDANRNGKVERSQDQDTISLGFGAKTVEFLIRNEGQGLLSFQMQPDGYWKARTSVFEPYPKIVQGQDGTLDPGDWQPLGTGVPPWLVQIDGMHGVSPRSLADGILADIKDASVKLTVDRTGLEPGHYVSRFQLLTTAGKRSLHLVFTVPPFAGDFEGSAFVSHVNGRRNEVGRVNLRLCISQQPSGMILGYIDSNATGIVPFDIPLVGHKTGSRIFLHGAYTLPARASNLNTPGKSAATGPKEERDAARLESNPFATRLSRFITIEGREVSPGQFQGDLHDIFHGGLPFSVHASGLAAEGAGLEISRSVAVGKSNAWFPLPEKAPLGTYPIRGKLANWKDWIAAGSPPVQIILTGMGRSGSTAVGTDGTWEVPGIPPGIYAIALTGGTSRRIEVKELISPQKVTGTVLSSDDSPGDPTQVSFLKVSQPPAAGSSLPLMTISSKEIPADLGQGETRLKCEAMISQGISRRSLVQPEMQFTFSKIRTIVIKDQP